MSMLRVWDTFHEIPEGAIVPAGTELAQLDMEEEELAIYTADVSARWTGAPKHSPVRSVDPLPDLDDTGLARLTVKRDGSFVIYNMAYPGDPGAILTEQQAHNFARKILEETNGH